LVVLSDHGGIKSTDGETNDESILIPWVANGPGVRKAFNIENYVSVMDTASLAAYVLGETTPSEWIGKPPLSIFLD